jgi:hypothetical protein
MMRAIAEYRKHAEECRKLAKLVTVPVDKNTFEEMAQTWEMLAKLRQGDIARKTERDLLQRGPAKPWG